MNLKNLSIILILCFAAAQLPAIDENAGTSGLQFLKIGLGAKQAASGESACASAEDVNTIFWNPAGLVKMQGTQISLSHNQWLSEVSEQSVSFCVPAGNAVYGGGILYLHMGDMTGYDIDSQGKAVKTADFTSYDIAGIFSYARSIQGIAFGANVKLIQEKIENNQASGAALDLGMSKPLSENIEAGLVLQNIGTSFKFIDKETPLPMNIKAGLACRILADRLLLTLDGNKPGDGALKASFGARYNLAEILAFRAGWNDKAGLNSNITFGVGIVISDWTVDYAYVPYGLLGDTHRVTITTGF